eukprot:CAMPEP_0119428546 /NCGR_PEP_ID=MMETSP1335-20130426/40673_1 /TAXON_ID=259385 /ORGANISM="Chrysoculter rhomboideus, Strain RCC1486" /LENGTH=47 /DNA_ID= /DNA_START= /DNA_END= /DNA_ORIENTATION=
MLVAAAAAAALAPRVLPRAAVLGTLLVATLAVVLGAPAARQPHALGR